jgi:[ribosomal protein S18]-alanine N-acetyltransferase
MGSMTIRRGEPGDLLEIRAIQATAPEAAQWEPGEYLKYELWVAVRNGRIVGFLVGHTLSAGEWEILNLVVSLGFRRQGVGRALLGGLLRDWRGAIFLEVRASNAAARLFYKSLGFQEVGSRPQYYGNPPESAIVMKFHSC